jgi:hypothetical protein
MKTSSFTVNNIGDAEAVAATCTCRRITIGENPGVTGWPTTDFLVTGNEAGSTPIQRPAGTQWTFENPVLGRGFHAGDIVGYVETVTGSTTFLKVEQ